MGQDCSLFIFPTGRMPRECHLARWYYMTDVYDALSVFGGWNDRVPARQMLAALEKLPPWEKSNRSDLMENAAHWRNVAIEYLHCVIKRWGEDVPTMILEEGFNHRYFSPRGTLERIERRRKYRERKESQQKSQRDKEESAIVYEWLAERRKRQWNGYPSIFSRFPFLRFLLL